MEGRKERVREGLMEGGEGREGRRVGLVERG